MNTRERIGHRLMELRRESGMTQEELSERSGVGRSHITRIEAGRYSVGVDILQKIAEALGCDVDIIKAGN